MRFWIALFVFALLPLSFVACGSPTATCGETGVSFKSCVQPILAKSCAGNGCHGAASPSLGLTLTENAVANSVGKASKQDATKMIVKAGDAENSWLLIKLKASPPVGQQMPSGGAGLPAAYIKLIETWVKEGAKDN